MNKNVSNNNLFIRLFREFENSNVRYVHWKSNQHLYEGLIGKTDIDLLVEADKSVKVEQILYDYKFKRFISKNDINYIGIQDWLGYDESNNKMVHLHLHYKLLTGIKGLKEQWLPWEEYILNSSQKDNFFSVYIINPSLELAVLYTRIVFKTSLKSIIKSKVKRRKIVPKNIEKEILFLRERLDEDDLYKHVKKLFSFKSDQVFNLILYADINNYQNFRKLKVLIKRNLYLYNRFNFLQRSKFILLRRITNILRFNKPRRVPVAGGKIISFVGSDGSGKSTISKEITAMASWKIETSNIYLGKEESIVLKSFFFFKSLFTTKKQSSNLINKNKSDPYKNEEESKSLKSKLLNLEKLYYAKQKYRKVVKANRDRSKGVLVITDRFPQEQLSGILDGPLLSESKNKWMRENEKKMFSKITQLKPNLVFKLLVDPEVAHKRKPDHNLEMLLNKTNNVKNLDFNKSKIIEIDASRELEEVLKDVKKQIWESL